mmetsp:Transcript_2831/g.7072  ORF Transcript_2831/g.7072 Transcript_2831/m.7072 type:complete len:238 (+) Transcript_2831:160-873(+)
MFIHSAPQLSPILLPGKLHPCFFCPSPRLRVLLACLKLSAQRRGGCECWRRRQRLALLCPRPRGEGLFRASAGSEERAAAAEKRLADGVLDLALYHSVQLNVLRKGRPAQPQGRRGAIANHELAVGGDGRAMLTVAAGGGRVYGDGDSRQARRGPEQARNARGRRLVSSDEGRGGMLLVDLGGRVPGTAVGGVRGRAAAAVTGMEGHTERCGGGGGGGVLLLLLVLATCCCCLRRRR